MQLHPEPFDNVRKLLALKRYEQPPPRYFQEFSGLVIARIQAAEDAAALPWWRRLFSAFEFQPAAVCATGLILSALFLTGMVISHKATERTVQREGPEVAALTGVQNTFALVSGNIASIDRPEEVPSSTTPVANAIPSSSPFSQVSWQAQPVNLVLTY